MAKTKDVKDDWSQIEIGDQVQHPKWGAGTVLFRSGTGEHAKAIVAFPEEGQKKLMLKYAKLKKTGTTPLKNVDKLREEKPKKKAAKPVVEEEIEADDDEAALDDDDEVVGFDDDDKDEITVPDDEENDE